MDNAIRYRADIDGLRAIAVLSVVAFHVDGRPRGGFVGVDVFFVISGFLISTIILEKIADGRFSIREFYARRVRRIFPALVTVLLAALIAGWYLLLADEYESLGKETAASALFVSNFLFYRETGYFAPAAESRPLLHLWSLAIEEQFYIFWPLLLAFAARRRWGILNTIGAVFAASFLLSVGWTRENRDAAFFLPFSRFWELMIGGGVAVMLLRGRDNWPTQRDSLSLVGFGMILVAFLLLDRDRLFPGFWALLPTTGTALLILAGPHAQLNKRLLAHPLVVRIGLISYPLYLWHWILLVFARNVTIDPNMTAGARAGIVVSSFFLSLVTYVAIELPIRSSRRWWTPLALAACSAVIALAAITIVKSNGMVSHGRRSVELSAFAHTFDNRPPDYGYLRRAGIPEKYRSECDYYDVARFMAGEPNPPAREVISTACVTPDPTAQHLTLLWGDSHASQFSWGLRRFLPSDWQLLQITTSGCAPRIAFATPNDACAKSNAHALLVAKQLKPEFVIVAQNRDHDLATFRQLAASLTQLGVGKVIVVGPTPHWLAPLPRIVTRRLWQDTVTYSAVGLDANFRVLDSILKYHLAAEPGIRYASVMDHFCNPAGCRPSLDDSRENLTAWDYGHLTPAASDYVAQRLLIPMLLADARTQKSRSSGSHKP